MAILLLALPIHEFAHAYAAHRLGDDTAARFGRLTLNPLRHLDPLGSLMIFYVGFDAAKAITAGQPRGTCGTRTAQRYALVWAAGPASNLALAVLIAAFWQASVCSRACRPASRTSSWYS